MGSITDYVKYVLFQLFLARFADMLEFSDILSFYKEEIKGETANYVSLVAASRGITKLDAPTRCHRRNYTLRYKLAEIMGPGVRPENSLMKQEGCKKGSTGVIQGQMINTSV